MPPTNQGKNVSKIKNTFVGLKSHFNEIDWASQDQLTGTSKTTGKEDLDKINIRHLDNILTWTEQRLPAKNPDKRDENLVLYHLAVRQRLALSCYQIHTQAVHSKEH